MAPTKHSADRTWSYYLPLSPQFAGQAARRREVRSLAQGHPAREQSQELSAAQSDLWVCSFPASPRLHHPGMHTRPLPALSSFSPHVTSCRGASLPSRPSFSLVILLTEQSTHSKLNGPYSQSRKHSQMSWTRTQSCLRPGKPPRFLETGRAPHR